MTTRKQLITEKYNELTTQLKKYTNEPIFPPIESIEITDLVFVFSLYFTGDDHVATIEKLMKMKGIELNDDEFTEVINIIVPFIDWFKSI
jgi:hypothetical protein